MQKATENHCEKNHTGCAARQHRIQVVLIILSMYLAVRGQRSLWQMSSATLEICEGGKLLKIQIQHDAIAAQIHM